ncbi:MAG: DUF3857 domain-containing protein [Bacteroidetes bacterium]|nr:MAG: DUF3857 domain-containing protein [Bacteroidota bacterium]
MLRFQALPLLFWLCGFLSAQELPDLSLAALSPQLLEGADAVIRYDYARCEVEGFDGMKVSYRFAVTRLRPRAPYDELSFPYDLFTKINKLRIYLYDASGRLVRKLDRDELEDYSSFDGFSLFDDTRYKYARVTHTQYPYTVVYELEKTFRNWGLPEPWSFQPRPRTAVETSRYELVVPAGYGFRWEVHNLELEPEIIEEGNRKRYVWEARHLAPLPVEPYAPPLLERIPYLTIAPERFVIQGYEGSLASWKDFGEFMDNLNRDRNNLSPEMKARLAALLDGVEDEREKVVRLYRFLQQNLRYVSVQLGIGGWQAFDAQYVEKNGFGDCKALTWFMKSMLEEQGIPSFPALVRAGEEDFLRLEKGGVPNLGFFNHVILHLPTLDAWLECTSNYVPPFYLGTFTDDRSVLLITDEGGKLAHTPPLDPALNAARAHTTVVLTPSGAAEVRYEARLSGSYFEDYLGVEHSDPRELERHFLSQTSLRSPLIERLRCQPRQERPEALLEARLEVPTFASRAGKRLFLPLNPVNVFEEVPPELPTRALPVVVPRSFVEEDSILIRLPEGFQVESLPKEPLLLQSDFGEYRLEVSREPGAVRVRRLFRMEAVERPPEAYEALRAFLKSVAKNDRRKMVLVASRT